MSRQTFKLPDLGEGTVSAEIVAWRVNVGDVVKEDQPVVEMSTEKAVVEVPSPFSGRVVALSGNPGDVVAVGGDRQALELVLAHAAAEHGGEPVASERLLQGRGGITFRLHEHLPRRLGIAGAHVRRGRHEHAPAQVAGLRGQAVDEGGLAAGARHRDDVAAHDAEGRQDHRARPRPQDPV